MRLTCPTCGASASFEAWQNDAACRSFCQVLVGLPGPVQARAVEYVGLFRPASGAGLCWKKALKILNELNEIINTGVVQWDGGEQRPAPVGIWAAAIEAVISRRPEALKNHNYLRHTAWSMAEKHAREAERRHEEIARQRRPTPPVSNLAQSVPVPAPASAEPRPQYTEEQRQLGLRKIREMREGLGFDRLVSDLADRKKLPERQKP
ncbi:MAG TPA: hypothetical protein PLU72_18395 [Candidatus Ozemobacteraceae bacterium]|nr:hypothetical protein [Candidatus Ozemobacteraceae bacterium]